jgi:hypothetical protein
MKSELFNDIVRFAMTRKSFLKKSLYLFEGILFAPFLDKASRRAAGDETVSGTSQAGDDIYPLF